MGYFKLINKGISKCHSLRRLRQAVKPARLELINILDEEPHGANGITRLVCRDGRRPELCLFFVPPSLRLFLDNARTAVCRKHGEKGRLMQGEGAGTGCVMNETGKTHLLSSRHDPAAFTAVLSEFLAKR